MTQVKVPKLIAAVLLAGVFSALSNSACSQDKTIKIKFANGQTVNSIANVTMLEVAKEINEKSKGRVAIMVYPANQLGNERDLAEGLRSGTIDMAYVSQAVMENFEPQLSLFSMPFIFNNQQHADKVVNGPIGAAIYDNLLKQKGIRVFNSWRQNFRFVYANKPILNYEGFKGLKIRVPESPTYVNTFKSVGSNPTPLPWGEVYTAMQTHVVDAFEVQSSSVATEKMYEVSNFVFKTRHIMASSLIMINEKKWQSLPADIQQIVREAVDNGLQTNYQKPATTEEQDLKLFAEKGMTIVEPSPADRQKLVAAVQDMWKEVPKKINAEDVFQQIVKAGM